MVQRNLGSNILPGHCQEPDVLRVGLPEIGVRFSDYHLGVLSSDILYTEAKGED